MKKLNRKCPKCGKEVKVAKTNNGFYFIKCNNHCNYKDDFINEDKQVVIDRWENDKEE